MSTLPHIKMDGTLPLNRQQELKVNSIANLIAERVPLEQRLRSVYIPITATDVAFYLWEDLERQLITAKVSVMRPMTRKMRFIISDYRKKISDVMQTPLYKSLSGKTRELYDSITMHNLVCRLQYQQALLDRGISITPTLRNIVATAYQIRDVMKYVIEVDREFTKMISDFLGPDVPYYTQDNQHSLDTIKCCEQLMGILGVPTDLKSTQTELAMKVLKNKINELKLWE